MTALVQGRGLTKSYGRNRGILQVSFDLAGGVRVPGSQRRRQDDRPAHPDEPVSNLTHLRRQDVAVRFIPAVSPDWCSALPNVQDATTEDGELQVHCGSWAVWTA